jgi:DNA-directed RNA polymerase subunit RPC12/RpoP
VRTKGKDLLANSSLIAEWNWEKNKGLSPNNFSIGSDKKIWWKCKNNHEWEAKIYSRKDGNGCPYCTGRFLCKENSLQAKNYDISLEWNYKKNGGLTPDNVIYGSSKKVWWECRNGHEWEAIIYSRSKKNGNGCPYCCPNPKPNKDNCLALKNKELAKRWNLIKNGDLTPDKITAHSGRKVWWKCKDGHEWKSKVCDMEYSNGCPICSKVELKDGTVWDSFTEAYMYLYYKKQNKKFDIHGKYGNTKMIYDFYFPSENKYVEVTGYEKTFKYWDKYHKKILRKKEYVENILMAKFEFVELVLTKKQRREIKMMLK